jgi:hypothetical protein
MTEKLADKKMYRFIRCKHDDGCGAPIRPLLFVRVLKQHGPQVSRCGSIGKYSFFMIKRLLRELLIYFLENFGTPLESNPLIIHYMCVCACDGHSPKDTGFRSGATAKQRPWPLVKSNGFIVVSECLTGII